MATRLKQDLSIGGNLQDLRKKAGLSQEAVIAQLSLMGITWVSRESLSQMELGKYSVRISVLLALKELYQADWQAFFEGLSWRSLVELEPIET